METRPLRYTQMISDGDCKSFTTLNEHKPYGNVKVVKHECVGHVQKRVMPKVKLARTSFKSDKANIKKKEKTLKDRMKKCLLGASQNCNESFNSLVWLRAPKTEFCSLATMKGTVGQAVIVFNSGKQALVKLMDQLHISAGPLCSSYLGRADQDRVKRARLKMEVVMKKRRQTAALRETRVEQQHIEEEGTTYLAGGFGGALPTPLNRLFSKPPHPKIFIWASECLSR